jgi:hypothetical protein
VDGNVRGLNGGSIDPALDQMAGGPVIVAAVPSDPASRMLLRSYAVNANRPAVTDTRAFRSLQERRDTVHINGTLAMPIGKKIDGSINLSMDSARARRLNGLAPALLTVPGSSDAFPFSNDVLLYRYIPGAILRQRNSSLTLHAGATLQGGLGQWAWNVTSSYDRVRAKTWSQQGLRLDDLQTNIDAGGDPLASVNLAGADWLIDRSKTVTGTWISKAVSNGPILRLPAGDAQLTVSLDYARSTSSDDEPSVHATALSLSRTIKGGSANAVVPIASAQNGGLPMLGTLSINGMIGVSAVSSYGRLTSSNYGMNWQPTQALQLSASLKNSKTAPEITLLTNPILITPNTPFFDFTTGNSVLVTTITGGNPDLVPEMRRVTTLSADLQPFSGRELRVRIEYHDTRIDRQSIALGSATPAFQAAYPERFVRGAGGELISVDLRPINVAQERERKIRAALSFSTSIGRKPKLPSNASGEAATATSPAKLPRPRPTVSLTISTTWRLEDRLKVQADGSSLDLLNGGTLTGIGGRPKWESNLYLNGTMGPLSFGVLARVQGPTRIASEIAASDLHFSGRTWIVPYGSLDLNELVKRPWARSLSVQLTIENLLNSRIKVRDRNGSTPYRFQSAFIDPLGRSVRLGVRKAF